MRIKLFAWLAVLVVVTAQSVTAQQVTTYLDANGNRQTVTPAMPLPVGTRESFQLATANTPSSPVTVFGGDYILSQTCTGYGTLTLRALGPDGVTYQTVLTKTGLDANGGTGLALASYATVQVTVSGTTGCYAILARVPA